MKTFTVSLPDSVADRLTEQARALALNRRNYLRALLAAASRHEHVLFLAMAEDQRDVIG